MDRVIRMRLRWVELYREVGNASFVCRRCGISAPTLRKWVRRFEQLGEIGLADASRRPLTSPKRKVDGELEQLILQLRKKRRMGARRLQSELLRHHQTSLALATIHKVLVRHDVRPLKRRRRIAHPRRYQRPIPGERVQIDTCKIAPALYQYTAVDDCSRYRVLNVYRRRCGESTIDFLEQAVEEMHVPIQRIQTDRGGEFFATKVQQHLMDAGIKFRPIKPGSPHLNGKVERSQRTDKEEFWSCLDPLPDDLETLREEVGLWQHYYNWHRPHGSLNGQTPIDRLCDLLRETPLWGEVLSRYDAGTERFQERDYVLDLRIRKLKGSV